MPLAQYVAECLKRMTWYFIVPIVLRIRPVCSAKNVSTMVTMKATTSSTTVGREEAAATVEMRKYVVVLRE